MRKIGERKSKISAWITKLTPILESRTILKEGLIKSVSVEHAYDVLNRLGYDIEIEPDPFYRPDYIMIDGDTVTTVIAIRFEEMPKYSEFKEFMRIINVLGYYISILHIPQYSTRISTDTMKEILSNERGIYDRLADNSLLMGVGIEPKYDMEFSAKRLAKIDTLYHISRERYAKKILSIGLSPKSQEKKSMHPDRVYLATSRPMALNLWRMFNSDPAWRDTYLLFSIDPNKLRSGFKSYIDPNCDDAIYTYNNIPPDAIIKIEKIESI